MSVVYRERDRYDDTRTSVSSSRRDGGYTTVKRYRIGEDDSRSSVDRRFQVNRPSERVEETRIVRREHEVEEPRRRDPDPRYSETDVIIRREREDEPRRRDPDPRYSETDVIIRREREDEPRRDYGYDRRHDDRDDTRELVIRRTTTRDEPREEERDLRVERYDVDRRDFRERDYELLSPDRDRHPDLQRYSRSTEYFSQPQAPQTIIIKQEPIIIRERVRGDDDYDIVRRSDVDDRQVARREPPMEEEYFYEKKVKEVEAPRREREDESYERRDREVSPHDSVSQVGRRERSRHRSRDYESDDSMVYVRKETREEDYSRDESPNHRRHIAEGVIAGVGAAEILRHHKNKKGEETSGTIGRIGKDVGAGVLGAVGAEVITRARSRYRSKSRRRDQSRSRSRSRSRSDSRETRKSRGRRHKKESRSRSRSESRSKLKTLGGLGLAAAGIAAAAAYAQKKSNDKKEAEEVRGRSHSRSRLDRGESTVDGLPDDARNPKHRNKRIAEAGLGGVVVAGLIEGARARSKAKKGERSRSRLRQGLEVAAAGLGSAAIAGMYERNKGKKEAEAAEKENRHQERQATRERSRSASRPAVGPYYDGNRALSDPGLIEYGDGPMYGNNYGADYYGRPAQPENYYSDAVVPAAGAGAAAAAAAYGPPREARDRSRSRSRARRSASSSPEPNDRRRRRHRKDRSRSVGEVPAVGAGVAGAGVALSEHERKQRKREEKARRRAAENAGRDPYEDAYDPAPYATAPPAAAPGGYGAAPGYYQQAPGFPPPPGTAPNQYPPQPQYAAPGGQYVPPPNQAEYSPGNFPLPPGTVPPQAPPANYNGAFASGANMDPFAPRTGRADENVSAAPSNGTNPFPDQHYVPPSGLNTTSGPPPPSIAVHPPAPTPPPAAGAYSSSYVPPAEPSQSPSEPLSQPRSESTSRRKSVKFTEGILTGDSLEPQDNPSQPTGLDDRRQQRRGRNGESSRGYDAGDDTGSTPEEYRCRQQGQAPLRSQTLATPNGTTGDPLSNRRRHHRRSRSDDPSSSTRGPRSWQSPEKMDRNATASPASDETIDLPERFDKSGRRKPEPGEHLLADKLEEILSGSGVGRRLFGNFADGLLGGSRGGSGSGEATGNSGRRR